MTDGIDQPIRRLLPGPTVAAATDEQLLQWYAPSAGWPGDDPDAVSVRFNFVSSADGSATLHGLSGSLSGQADKRIFQLLRRHTDTIVVGAQTVRAEGYAGPLLGPDDRRWRREQALSPHPVPVVVSGTLRLDPSGDFFTRAPVRPIVVTAGDTPADRRRDFDEVADVITCGQERIDVDAMLAELRARGHRRILCEGGPHLFGTFIEARRVDELCLTLSPALVGGPDPRIAAGAGSHAPIGMVLAHVLESDGSLFLRYAAPASGRDGDQRGEEGDRGQK